MTEKLKPTIDNLTKQSIYENEIFYKDSLKNINKLVDKSFNYEKNIKEKENFINRTLKTFSTKLNKYKFTINESEGINILKDIEAVASKHFNEFN